MVSYRQYSTWWPPWGNSTKTAPENCEKPGRAGVWTSHGISKLWRKYESDQLRKCSNGLRGPSTAEKSWWFNSLLPAGGLSPGGTSPMAAWFQEAERRKSATDLPRRKQLSSTSGGLNPDLNKIKRKFLRRQKFSFYFGASIVRTTLNSTLIRL